jgi:hypothetical protein
LLDSAGLLADASKMRPQGLKPVAFWAFFGTTLQLAEKRSFTAKLSLAVEFLLLLMVCISDCLMSGGHIFGFQTHVSPALLRRNQFLHAQ